MGLEMPVWTAPLELSLVFAATAQDLGTCLALTDHLSGKLTVNVNCEYSSE